MYCKCTISFSFVHKLIVLIVAKCIVNIDYINGLGRAEISINSSKVYCKYFFGGKNGINGYVLIVAKCIVNTRV